jgi:hydroxymethylglutaryl-CoA reductase
MGQSEVIEFFERMIKQPRKKFTKEEMETAIGKKIENYTLKSMYEHGDIKREKESVKISSGGETRRYVYSYAPNGFSSVTNFHHSKSSAVPDFYEISANERIKIISEFCGLDKKERRMLWSIDPRELSNLGENSTGPFPYVLRWINYLKINDRDLIVPTVIEEASVVAANCYASKLCYYSGGVQASVVESKEYSKAIGQIQITDIKDSEKARMRIFENKDSLLAKAAEGHEHSKPYDLGVEEFDSSFGKFLVVNLYVNPEDAMGAIAGRMADSIVNELSKITESKCSRGINSNYSGRLTKAELKVPIENLARKSRKTGEKWSGEEVKEGILKRYEWATKDVKRAVTNNKGIMNDVVGVARATAQDDRAIEAANAIYAIRSGCYQPLSKWRADDNYLYGESEMLIPCGTVGGEIKNYPRAEFLLNRVLRVKKADELAEIMASVGLTGNLAALSMISTIGLEEGHQPHRK